MTNAAGLRQQQIDQMILALSSNNASVREQAAEWLGEAAADVAIDDLVALYQNDKDKGVRRAAAYALGQFRAIDVALQRGKEDKVVRLLTAIETEGKLGRRANRRRWVVIVGSLLLSLLVLLLGLYYLPAGLLAEVVPTIERPVDVAGRARAAAQIREPFELVRNNILTLQSQFLAVLRGEALDCSAFFNIDLQPPVLSAADAAAFPDLAQAAQITGDMMTREGAAREQFNAACAGAPFDAAAAGPAYALIVPAVQVIPQIEALLDEAEAAAANLPESSTTAVAPTAGSVGEATESSAPTAAPPSATPIPSETPVPTAAIAIVDPVAALRDVSSIFETLNAPRGPLYLLIQYWTDASEAGQTQGCADITTATTIPDNYDVPQGVAEAAPLVAEAAGLLNVSLDTVRTGWSVFSSACQTGNLQPLAAGQLADLNTAASRLIAVDTLLQTARNS
jgi:hypothetical protein